MGSHRAPSNGSDEDGHVLQRRHRPDYRIVLYMGLLMLMGLVVIYAIGPQRANVLNNANNTTFYTATYFVIKQFISLAIAGLAFAFFAVVPFTLLKKHSIRLLQVGFGLCLLLFIAGNILHIDQIATSTLGAYRWFNLGALGSFQPSEVLKFTILIYVAGFLGKRFQEGRVNSLKDSVYPVLGVAALGLGVIAVLQKDMGTSIALVSIVFSMLIASHVSWKLIGKIAGIGLIAGVLLILMAPHRMDRVVTFFNSGGSSVSDSDASDNNYHIKNAMIALGSGGLTGRGIGQSVQAAGYLPEAVNDSIFAVMGEIFGFVGTALIIVLFSALLLRLLRIADNIRDMPMRLAVAGVFGWLAAHVVMNIASMTGLVPLTGITLPLLSFGGTSMVFMAGALGLVFQLSRFTSHKPVDVKEGARNEGTHSRWGVRRTRYAGRRSS
ncbi:MAG: FtsW/RodA/SpoVE family cell cycle protein [Candidatus Saccharimonas sp.]